MISVCTIMKNEEKHLDNFLSAIESAFKGIDYEVVLVDTGSTDSSIEIARNHGIEPIIDEWRNDFAYSRNVAAEHARGEIILALDCDEYIRECNTTFLLSLMSSKNIIGKITIDNHQIGEEGDSIYQASLPRAYYKEYAHFEGIVHEQILPIKGPDSSDDAVPALGGINDTKESPVYVDLPLKVEHFGYALSFDELQKKTKRNLSLLCKQLEDNPEDPFTLFHIGQCYNMLHDDENAAAYYSRALCFDLDPSLEYVQMMVTSYGYNLLHLGRLEDALSLSGIYDEFSTTADFCTMMGLVYMRNERYIDALNCYLKAVTFPTSRSAGANSYIPLYNMGLINEMFGNKDGAVELYKKCGSYKPAADRLAEI